MSRWSSIKEVVALAVNNWRLWLMQFVGNAALFLAFVWWLHISEAHWWNLLFSLVLIAAIIAAALLLHGGTLNYLQSVHQDRNATISPSCSRALKHLPAIFAWALIFFLLRDWMGHLDRYAATFPGYLRSEFPVWLRRMISEPALDNIYAGFVFLLRWVLLPGLLLPFAVFATGKGFRGLIAFSDWRRTLWCFGYWVALLIAALLGVCCVEAIMGWKLDSRTSTLQGEKVSLAFRLLFAYLLGIVAWLLTASVLGRGVARRTEQPATQAK